MSEMIPFNSLNKHSPRCFDFARDDAINTPNDIVHVILSETQCTWGPHKITFLWGIGRISNSACIIITTISLLNKQYRRFLDKLEMTLVMSC